jgi:eukaryotic-like serine/threonine-protein kinase
MAALLRATDAGYRNLDKLRTDPYLGLLRDRADFRALLLDLAFPNDPFTQGR